MKGFLMKNILSFFFALFLAVGYLVLAGVLGAFDAEHELTMLETTPKVTEGFELLCADATRSESDEPSFSAKEPRPALYVSHQERMDRFLLKCVVR